MNVLNDNVVSTCFREKKRGLVTRREKCEDASSSMSIRTYIKYIPLPKMPTQTPVL
jgi:hypothetical protein